ncbi:hypothetical protein [Paraburkholderia youngii]|uniref:hypothetical protein n=1 Tax=Paraburkholderia youngii TaxID=2782701 RepID=UPI003D1D6996
MKIGRIELDMNARCVRRDGQDLRLGSRAVDLSSAATTDEVLRAIAYGCGVDMPEDVVCSERLGAALSNAAWLLVLDGAEHVISVVAQIVEALLAAA